MDRFIPIVEEKSPIHSTRTPNTPRGISLTIADGVSSEALRAIESITPVFSANPIEDRKQREIDLHPEVIESIVYGFMAKYENHDEEFRNRLEAAIRNSEETLRYIYIANEFNHNPMVFEQNMNWTSIASTYKDDPIHGPVVLTQEDADRLGEEYSAEALLYEAGAILMTTQEYAMFMQNILLGRNILGGNDSDSTWIYSQSPTERNARRRKSEFIRTGTMWGTGYDRLTEGTENSCASLDYKNNVRMIRRVEW
jgi:hypothetical protein